MLKVLDLNAVVSNAELMVRHVLGPDIRVTAILASALDPVFADMKQLQNIIVRLAGLARNAMPWNGRFTIETRNVVLDQHQVPGLRPGAYVMLALSDNGPGITDVDMEQVFHDDANRGDYAVNLASIPDILQSMGGCIHVASEHGEGVTFSIYLPCYLAYDQIYAPRVTQGLRHGAETILVVDDDDLVRSFIRTLLGTIGYAVHEAIDGAEAIHITAHLAEPIDLLITDLSMPGVDGKALIERLHILRPAMKVLLISGLADDQIAQQSWRDFNFAFLQKPFKCEEFARLVRSLLDTPGSQLSRKGIFKPNGTGTR